MERYQIFDHLESGVHDKPCPECGSAVAWFALHDRGVYEGMSYVCARDPNHLWEFRDSDWIPPYWTEE